MRSSKMTFLALAAVLGVALVGCTNKLSEKLVVQNVDPMGSVGGQVLDGTDDSPLPGATVRVVSGDFNQVATTDSSGFWSVSDVPASGPVLIFVEASGMLSAETMETFTPAAGDYPLDNATLTVGPMGLLPSSGEFSLWVYDENGRPASGGYTIALTTNTRWLQYDDGYPANRGAVTTFASVGSNGLATFQGLPDYWMLGNKVSDYVVVTAPPYDADGDGFYDFAGSDTGYYLLSLDNPQPTLLLATGPYPDVLSIIASNLADLEEWGSTTFVPGVVNPNGPINVLFNMPVQEDSLAIEVWSEDGNTSFGSSFTLNGRSLTIQFPTALDSAITGSGAEFNLLISAVAQTGDLQLYGGFNAAFFVMNDANPDITASVAKEDPGDPNNYTTYITFSEPVGFGSPNTSLAGANCVLYFGISNLGAGLGTGDDPGEWGYGSCSYSLDPDEPDPFHPSGAGLSGYSTRWKFEMPTLFTGGNMPSGITMYLAFDQVANTNRIMRRANGEPLEMLDLTTP